MQTILGSGGAVGTPLAEQLQYYTKKVRLLSRYPKQVTGKEELMTGDLLKRKDVMRAVKGSKIVYLTVGLKYSTKVWQRDWPIVMRNVIDACKTHNAKLVFFDNVYMYGKVSSWMMETSPFDPCSRKGEVRAKVATMLLDEMNSGNITALIARAPDFYGPAFMNSILNKLIFERLVKRQKPQVLISPNFRHSFIYTPDAAYGAALLGNTPSAYNQTWHLPTSHRVPYMGEIVEYAKEELMRKVKISVLPLWQIKLAGTFIPEIGESIEMMYQYDRDYLFDSGRFQAEFHYIPITYDYGVKHCMNCFQFNEFSSY